MAKPRMAYAAETSAQLNEAAVGSCVVQLFPSEDDPLEIEVTGTCPACGEDIVHSEPLVVVRGIDSGLTPETSRAVLSALRAAGMPLREQDVVVRCRCSTAHPGAPDGVTGCGRWWVLHVEWGLP